MNSKKKKKNSWRKIEREEREREGRHFSWGANLDFSGFSFSFSFSAFEPTVERFFSLEHSRMNSLSSSQLSIERSQRQRLWNGNKIKDKNPSELFVKSSFLCDGFFYDSPFILRQKPSKDCTFAAIKHVRHR